VDQQLQTCPFFMPNMSYKLLIKLCSITNLIQIFACMLLEKKIIFVAKDKIYQQ